jgi:hypothetical protein
MSDHRSRKNMPAFLWQVFAVAFLLLLVSGCASMEKSYMEAKQKDTVSGWNYFLRNYPKSEYAPTAKARVEELKRIHEEQLREKRRKAWNEAKNANTIESYWGYMEKHEDGENAADANAAFERLVQEKVNAITHGDNRQIRPGVEFPLNKFKIQQLIDAVGEAYLGTYENKKTQGSKIIERHVNRAYRMLSPSCGTEEYALCFLRKDKNSVILSFRATEVDGKPTETAVTINGQAYAIVRFADGIRVYELNDNSWEYSVR